MDKMSIQDKVKEKLLKELELFNDNFEKYKDEYMDKDDPSGKCEIAEELLSDVKDVFSFLIKEKEKKCECSICLEEIDDKNNNCKLGCGHKFHFDCIVRLNQSNTSYGKKCPLCRKEFINNANTLPRTIQTIHDISVELPGLRALLIHNIIHLSDTQLTTLSNLFDVLE